MPVLFAPVPVAIAVSARGIGQELSFHAHELAIGDDATAPERRETLELVGHGQATGLRDVDRCRAAGLLDRPIDEPLDDRRPADVVERFR